MFLWAVQAEVSKVPFRWHVQDENLACGLCYTSGTTGNPKVLIRPPPLPLAPPLMAMLHPKVLNPHSFLGPPELQMGMASTCDQVFVEFHAACCDVGLWYYLLLHACWVQPEMLWWVATID